jgi:hypothetical protein
VLAKVMVGDKASKDIAIVTLSNNTVHSRITDKAENVKQQLLLRVRQISYYALQADELTDIVNAADLLLFVRYEINGKVNYDILFCQPYPTRTTGEAIFKVIDDFIKNNTWICVYVTG